MLLEQLEKSEGQSVCIGSHKVSSSQRDFIEYGIPRGKMQGQSTRSLCLLSVAREGRIKEQEAEGRGPSEIS